MTRRERHLRIIESWGSFHFRSGSLRYEFDRLIGKHGLAALKDEAVEELAANLWRSRRRQNRMNAENRKIREARAAATNNHVAEPFRSALNSFAKVARGAS